MFKTVQKSGRAFGRIINSKPVSTISKGLVEGGKIATKIIDNPKVEALVASTAGPEGLAALAGARGLATGAIQAGKGIQRVKDATNKSPFKPSYVD